MSTIRNDSKSSHDGSDNFDQKRRIAEKAEYLAKIDSRIEQLEAGEGQEHELIEAD